MRNHYWTIGPFADWLRGTPSPGALTHRGWKEWRAEAEARHPFRYWLADEGLDYLQRFFYYIPDRLYAIKYYINNRWVSHSHRLTAHSRDIKPGSWCDVGNRFLPCLFNELVDFVEIEQAWHHVLWSDEERKKYEVPWWRKGFLRWRTWRCPEAGLEYLRWAANLKMDDSMGLEPGDEGWGEPTQQAKAAKEIIELYTWWTEVYPNRPDVHDASGWTAYCDMRRAKGYDFLDMDDKTEAEAKQCREALDKSQALELQYEQEDEAMMIRLIKIRQSLWT